MYINKLILLYINKIKVKQNVIFEKLKIFKKTIYALNMVLTLLFLLNLWSKLLIYLANYTCFF